MLKSFPLRQPKFGGNNKISSRANTNKVEKITSSEASLLKRERECEKYLKSCMSSWFRSFCSDLYIMARSWEKSCRSKLLRNFCTSKMDLFEAPVCNSVGYRKNKIPILTNRTKTKSWEDKLRNGRVCESRIESKRSFGSQSWKMWVNWKLTQVSPMYFCVCVVSSSRASTGIVGQGPPGLSAHLSDS